LLRNQSYIGIKEVNKGKKGLDTKGLSLHEKYQVVKASWPAIIDESTFYIVQKMLDDNAQNERIRLSDKQTRIYLVSGIATCGECGRALVGSAAHGRTSVIRYYTHRPIEGQSVKCSTKRIQADFVETTIVNHFLHVIQREGYLDGIEDAITKNLSGTSEQLQGQRSEAQKKLTELDSDRKKLMRLQIQNEDLVLHTIYSEQLLETKNQQQKQSELLETISRKLEETPRPSDVRASVEINLKRLLAAWSKATPKMQKSLIRAIVDRLIFNSDSIDIYYRPTESSNYESQSSKSKKFTGAIPVDLSQVRESKKLLMENQSHFLENQGHNEKVNGSYVIKIGCGNRI
jgi:hypothetical protein